MRRAGKNGFSMIELLVVLVVIGIMTAVIVGEMAGTFEDALLRSSSRELIGAISLAHSQAVTVHQPHRVRIDVNSGTYQVEGLTQIPGEKPEFAAIEQIPRSVGELDPRISIQIRKQEEDSDADTGTAPENRTADNRENPAAPDSGNTLLFHPDGTAERMEIVLRDRTGVGLSLRVNPITSRVSLVNLDREPPL